MGTVRRKQSRMEAVSQRGTRRVSFSRKGSCDSLSHGYAGFTLTELLVVIVIISILASLITAAAVNAMRRGNEGSITLEIGQLGQAIEEFKNKYGAYPPNVFSNLDTSLGLSNQEKLTNAQNVVRFMRKVAPRSTELNSVMSTPPVRGTNPNAGADNIFPIYQLGVRPSEALVLWLSGFSGDPTRPFSGEDLEATMIYDEENDQDVSDAITFDSFDAPLFDFDKTRLRLSRNADGSLRWLEVYRGTGIGPGKLLLYEYLPERSEKPYVYFNTVDSPEQVVRTWEVSEIFYLDPNDNTQVVYPLKQRKPNAPTGSLPSPAVQFLEYVNQGKFQIMHAGVDDVWGDFSNAALNVQGSTGFDYIPPLRFPEGPFTGDVADTLTNFTTGTLENAQE